MSKPWLTIIGIGEDGPAGLTLASQEALADAEIIFGGPRHLELLQAGERGRPWPVPFSVQPVLDCEGKSVVVLASGDPFWHGVGGSLAAHLSPECWRVFPAPSCTSLAAARIGWRLEETVCLGLHAAPFAQLVPHLVPGQRVLCTLRHGDAPAALAQWLSRRGFGTSSLTVFEALGGPRERTRRCDAQDYNLDHVTAPVTVAIEPSGGPGMSQAPGRPIDDFIHDGQITKSPMRALTLSALAPRIGEHLWDIGAGSGAISVEWALAARGCSATAVETRADRLSNIAQNIAHFGLQGRITAIHGQAPKALSALPAPAAVFIGGGASDLLLRSLWAQIPKGCRLVANGVTLETQTLLSKWHAKKGGDLLRVDLAHATPLGRMHGWSPARPQLQWSITR